MLLSNVIAQMVAMHKEIGDVQVSMNPVNNQAFGMDGYDVQVTELNVTLYQIKLHGEQNANNQQSS